MRFRRTLLSVIFVGFFSLPAMAQDIALRPGWSFNLGAYLWLPTLDGKVNYALPTGAGGTADVSVDAGDYFSKLNFAALIAAEVRYERVSLITDLVHMNIGTDSSHLNSVNISGLPSQTLSTTTNKNADTNLKALILTMAGGFTTAAGSWGNVDVIGGFRYFGAELRTDYTLSADIAGPGGHGVALSRNGRLSGSQDIWNGIIGLRGRLRLGESGFFVPYYVDVGTGDSRLTSQVFSGIGYQTGAVGVQLGYRYLHFDQRGNSLTQDLTMQGAYLALNYSF
jgi:hypothetical protein